MAKSKGGAYEISKAIIIISISDINGMEIAGVNEADNIRVHQSEEHESGNGECRKYGIKNNSLHISSGAQ